jgi:hypothetical protein
MSPENRLGNCSIKIFQILKKLSIIILFMLVTFYSTENLYSKSNYTDIVLNLFCIKLIRWDSNNILVTLKPFRCINLYMDRIYQEMVKINKIMINFMIFITLKAYHLWIGLRDLNLINIMKIREETSNSYSIKVPNIITEDYWVFRIKIYLIQLAFHALLKN